MLAMSRSLSMPEAPFDDLITELGGAVEEDHPLSAGLDTLDMQLPSMELTPDMQGELVCSRMSPRRILHIGWAHLADDPGHWNIGTRAEANGMAQCAARWIFASW